MSTVLRTPKRAAMCLAIACLAMMVTPIASAVPPSEVLRVVNNQAFQGFCCFSWLETVRVNEPATIAPVIVTWSTDYQATGDFFAGLSVNGGPCESFGSGSIEPFAPFGTADGRGQFESRTFQWFILPSDGLVQGNNTFTLCGGTRSDPANIILLGFNTLAARVSK